MIYLLTFSLAVLSLWASSKCKGVLAFFLILLGLTLPCLVAGVRDESVGTDVFSYAKWMSVDAQSLSLTDYLQHEAHLAGVGWNLFSWISVRLTGGLPGYLLLIELLCIVPIYCGLRRVSPGFEWLGILMWLLLEYSFSMNGMRQSAAMGFVFYATTYLLERKPYQFVFWVFIGILFHQTAIIALLFYPFSRIFASDSKLRKILGKYFVLTIGVGAAVCGAALLLFGQKLVLLLSAFKQSYSYQVSHLGESDFSLAGAYLSIGMFTLWLLVRRRNNHQEKYDDSEREITRQLDTVFMLVIAGSLLWQLDLISATLGRLGYYGTGLVPLLGGLIASKGDRSRIRSGFLILFLLIYFIAMVIVLEKNGTWPYTSLFLGIS